MTEIQNAYSYEQRRKRRLQKLRWQFWHIDPPLFFLLILLGVVGILILYSASNSNFNMVAKQMLRMVFAFGVMLVFAKIPPSYFYRWAPWFFVMIVALLFLVLLVAKFHHGGKRWMDLAGFIFQPSEFMKLAMPLMLSYYLSDKSLPPNFKTIAITVLILFVPFVLIAKQPDLGTAILVLLSGIFILILAGLSIRLLITLFSVGILSTPILWYFMHQYQKDRVLTLLNPERNPLGTGYHIIQSKIALGSGGFLGKGFLHGTQSHLQFLPAHATDFIYAVAGEEFGLLGCLFIILLVLAILSRCLYISINAQNNFTRLLSGSLCLTFFTSAFINIGMVIGILPVVGVPLPLISYGGSSMLTLMASFGMIMSIHTHRKLWSS